jgi:hypothetical protein
MLVTATALLVVSVLIAGCGPKPAPAPTDPAGSASPAPTVKALAPGDCTLFTQADAVSLLGAVNDTNPLIPLDTGGGEKIDVCFYGNLQFPASISGTGYAVVRYDSPETAAAMVAQVRTEMLDSVAGYENWTVSDLTLPATGSGPVLGGYGTETEDGLTFTLAVAGTNVGPYLVAADGGSTTSPDDAKRCVTTVLQKLVSQFN